MVKAFVRKRLAGERFHAIGEGLQNGEVMSRFIGRRGWGRFVVGWFLELVISRHEAGILHVLEWHSNPFLSGWGLRRWAAIALPAGAEAKGGGGCGRGDAESRSPTLQPDRSRRPANLACPAYDSARHPPSRKASAGRPALCSGFLFGAKQNGVLRLAATPIKASGRRRARRVKWNSGRTSKRFHLRRRALRRQC